MFDIFYYLFASYFLSVSEYVVLLGSKNENESKYRLCDFFHVLLISSSKHTLTISHKSTTN